MVSLGGLEALEELSKCCDGARDEARDEARGVSSDDACDEDKLDRLTAVDRGADRGADRLALLEECSVVEDAASRLEGSSAAFEGLLVCSFAVKGQYVV